MRYDIRGRSRVASPTGGLFQTRGGRSIGPGSGSSGGLAWTWVDYEPLIGSGETVADIGSAGSSHGRFRLWSNGEIDILTMRIVIDGTDIDFTPSGAVNDYLSFSLPMKGDVGSFWYGSTAEAWWNSLSFGKDDPPQDGWHGTAFVTDASKSLYNPVNDPYYTGLAIPSWYLPPGSNLPALAIYGGGDEIGVENYWSQTWPEWDGAGWEAQAGIAIHVAFYSRFTTADLD